MLPDAWKSRGQFNESKFLDWLCATKTETKPARELSSELSYELVKESLEKAVENYKKVNGLPATLRFINDWSDWTKAQEEKK